MAYNRWLAHHGVKGQKWGEKNGPPYPLDSSKSDGHKLLKGDGSPQGKKKYKSSEKTAHKRATRKVRTVFVSGSSKTQDETSGYYRKELPKDIQKQLDSHMSKGNRIIVGDAPGIDRQVQDYLNSKNYKNVEIYGPGKQVRYSANSKWKTNPIDDPDHEPGSKEWLAKKDIAMTEAADEGLAIVLDEGAKATRKNIQRLSDSGKNVKVYSLNQDGSDSWEDDWDRKWNTSYASKDVKKANDIYKTLSKQEKYFLTAEENSKRYVSREEYAEYLDDRDAYAKKGLAEATREEFNRRFAQGDPNKFFNRVLFGSKANNRQEYNDYMNFLKQVDVSNKYIDLHNQQEEVLKNLSKSYTQSRELEEQGIKPSDNQYLKQYQQLLKKSNEIHDETKKEACRLLGVDIKKLTGINADYVDETIYETQLRKKEAATSEKQPPTKPQKKSISERINSFKDRIFGSSKKAQEKGQQKVSVNYEPVTSEKAKTKRGETYEINDWNGNAQDTIKAFKKDPESHIDVARKAAVQEARQIIGWYAKDNPEAQRLLNMSDQQLSKRIGLDFVSAHSHGTIEFSFGDAGTGDFLGHEVDVEYDLDRRKVMNVSVNG